MGRRGRKEKERNPPGMYLATFPISTSSVASYARSRPGEQSTGVPARGRFDTWQRRPYMWWWDQHAALARYAAPIVLLLCRPCAREHPALALRAAVFLSLFLRSIHRFCDIKIRCDGPGLGAECIRRPFSG